MTIFENYTENGELKAKIDEPVTAENLEQFLGHYDPKLVQGYAMALVDFNKALLEIVWDSAQYLPRTAPRVRTLINQFHSDKKALVEKFLSSGISLPTSPDF